MLRKSDSSDCAIQTHTVKNSRTDSDNAIDTCIKNIQQPLQTLQNCKMKRHTPREHTTRQLAAQKMQCTEVPTCKKSKN